MRFDAKTCKIGGMRRDIGCFRGNPRHHLRYQAARNRHILLAASLPVSAGTGGPLYFVDSAETT